MIYYHHIYLCIIHRAKILDSRVRTDVIIMGKKYTAEEALEAKLVEQICDDSELLNSAIQHGKSVVGSSVWDRKHMANLKSDLYWEVHDHKNRMDMERIPLKEQMSKL